MSQNAESARDWINREQPSRQQLENALAAIQRKISDHPQLTAEQRDDLHGAASAVREELELIAYSIDSDASSEANPETPAAITADLSPLGAASSTGPNHSLDTGADLDLGDLGQQADPNVQALEGSAKRQAFEQLKAHLKSSS